MIVVRGNSPMRYAVRKTQRKWAVCAGRLRLLEFDSFEEALQVARNAAVILSKSPAASQCEQADRAAREQDGSIEIHQIDDRQIAVLT